MKPTLSPEQQVAFDDVVNERRSCLITGNGGTGKSFLLDSITETLWKHNVINAVTASTGIAALNVSGATIHSWSGLGIGHRPTEQIAAIIRARARDFNNPTLSRVRRCECLFIDEISMLDGRFVDKLSALMSELRDDDAPFGGCQVVFLGDFLQLPPVTRDIPQFAFECKAWQAINPPVHLLTKTFRQEDQQFSSTLNDVRMGRTTPAVRDLLNECFTRDDPDPDKPGIILHTHNAGCDKINVEGLEKLLDAGADSREYDAVESDKAEQFAQQLDKTCLAPRRLHLAVGARVMLLKNIDPTGGLANGSLGTVTRVYPSAVHVKFDNGRSQELQRHKWELFDGDEVLATRSQIPLRLAYAVTVHKSQGMTLDKLYCHLDKCFSPGQAYVALSRARSREGLFIRGGTSININANARAVQFYSNL